MSTLANSENETGPASGRPRWLTPALAAALVVLTLAVFAPSLSNGFVNFDDADYVTSNPAVDQGLTWRGLIWAFSFHAGNWHPLTWLSHMLDCQIYDLHPAGHHATNVLLHAAAVALLFFVLRRMTEAIWPSAFVAAVFALHPLRVESVAWVAERKDVLSGLFFILTIAAYLRHVRAAGGWRTYWPVVALAAAGLMCKPMLVSLPLVLLLLDWWPLRRTEPFATLLVEKIPLFALSAVACVLTILAQAGSIETNLTVPMLLRLENAAVTSVVYLWQMVWPAGLAVLYPFPRSGMPFWQPTLAVVFLAAVSVGVLKVRRTKPWLAVGWFWYLIMLLPVLGIVQVGEQAHADRYTYLPQIGIYMAVAWLVAGWFRNIAAKAALAAIVLALFSGVTWRQISYWHDSETLWRRAIDRTSGNFVAHNNLGDALSKLVQFDAAIAEFKTALKINPAYPEPENNWGYALLQQGKVDEAIVHYQKAVEVNQTFVLARNNLANAFLFKGDLTNAVGQYREALRVAPDSVSTMLNLGNALRRAGKLDEAVTQFDTAVRLEPTSPIAHNDLADAFLAGGNLNAAIPEYESAIRFDPRSAELRSKLGLAYSRAGQLGDAIAAYDAALRIDPNYADARIMLARALADSGDLDGAILQLQKVVQHAPGLVKAHGALADIYVRKGNVVGALAEFEAASKIDSRDPWVKNNLAWLLATASDASLRNGHRALDLAWDADRLAEGGNPVFAHTLGAALAETGQFSEALDAVTRAMSLAEKQNQPGLVGQFKLEAESYRAHKPVRFPTP